VARHGGTRWQAHLGDELEQREVRPVEVAAGVPEGEHEARGDDHEHDGDDGERRVQQDGAAADEGAACEPAATAQGKREKEKKGTTATVSGGAATRRERCRAGVPDVPLMTLGAVMVAVACCHVAREVARARGGR